jgi:hypothetical protein
MSLDPVPPRGRVAGLLGTRMLHAAAEHPGSPGAPLPNPGQLPCPLAEASGALSV